MLTLLLGWSALGLRADYDPRSFHPQGSEFVAATRHAERVFGADDRAALVAVIDPALFTPAGLARVNALTGELERLEGVERVVGPTNVMGIHGGLGDLALSTLIGHLPQDLPAAVQARERLRSDPLASGLVSQDGSGALIQVIVRESWAEPDAQSDLYRRVRATLDAHASSDVELLLGGFPMVRAQYREQMLGEIGWLFGGVALALLALLAATLRSVRGALLAVLPVLTAIVWTLGLMALAGSPFIILSMLTPVLVLVVGVSDAVHLLLAFRGASGERSVRAAEAVRMTALPCLLTSATTAVGFLALLSAWDVRMLQIYGLFTAVGVLAAWAATMALVPALLASEWVGFDRSPPNELVEPARLDGLVRDLVARPRRVLLGGSAVALVLVGLASTVSTDAPILDGLRPSHPIMATYRALETRFGGSLPMSIVYDAGGTDGIAEPALWGHMERTTAFLDGLDGVGIVRSPHVVVQQMEAALGDGPARLPETSGEVSELFLLASFADVDPFEGLVAETDGVARIRLLLHERGSQATMAVQDQLQAELDARPLQGVQIDQAGTAWIAPRAWRVLQWRMLVGLGIAILAISLLFAAIFRSPAMGLWLLPPNLLPLVAVLAAMALLSIPAKGNNAVIFSIAYGIAVDDTIHLLTRLWRERRAGHPWDEAIVLAHRQVRGPIALTSLVLAVGFAAFLFSAFEFNLTLGLQMIVTVAVALAADLVLLPALLGWWSLRGAEGG